MKKTETRTEETIHIENTLRNQILYDYPCKGENARLINSFKMPTNVGNPYTYVFDYPYFVTDKGQIINATNGETMDQYLNVTKESDKKDKAYLKVSLRQSGDFRMYYVHRLVAYAWCPNNKGKYLVHHIDCDAQNNNANNLIFVTQDEQTYAHALIRTGNVDAYAEYIERIRGDNGKQFKDVCCVLNPGFEITGCGGECLWITQKGYDMLKQGVSWNEVLTTEIRGEGTGFQNMYEDTII